MCVAVLSMLLDAKHKSQEVEIIKGDPFHVIASLPVGNEVLILLDDPFWKLRYFIY